MKIVAGEFKNRTILAPKGESTRPTSNKLREALFNICQHYIEQASFLDLFAGSGAIGFEALSRGASYVTFVEKEREAIRYIKKNVELLEVQEKCAIVHGDVFAFLDRVKVPYDIIYADPPYGANFGEIILKGVDDGDFLKKEGMLFIEESVKASIERLPLKKLEVVSSRRLGRSMLWQYRKFE